jgi:2-C-methyl-D-erythritol 4-phosphate cytidylyltransferase
LKVLKDLQVILDYKGLKVKPDLKAPKEHLALMGLKAFKDHKVFKEAILVIQDHKDLRAHKVLKDYRAQKVPKDFRGL